MKRHLYLKYLIAEHKLGEGLWQIMEFSDETRLESTAINLMARYNGLRREIANGSIYREHLNVQQAQLINAAISVIADLKKEKPQLMGEEVDVPAMEELDPDPVTEVKLKGETQVTQNTFNIHGEVKGGIINDNKGTINQEHTYSNQKTEIKLDLPMVEQLVEAEKGHGYITEEEYEELMEILEEIKEGKEPSEREQKRWKRWLSKAVHAGSRFVGKRIEKGVDTTVGEGLKKWLGEGGLDTLANYIASFS